LSQNSSKWRGFLKAVLVDFGLHCGAIAGAVLAVFLGQGLFGVGTGMLIAAAVCTIAGAAAGIAAGKFLARRLSLEDAE